MGFTFVDLCCGVGGFAQACHSHGGECLLACDIDPVARDVYELNYGLRPHTDVTKLKHIPSCDILCSGFPCVTFSSIGKREGTSDPRGKIFYYILKLVKKNPPNVLLFENVKGLLFDDDGRTFRRFHSMLSKLGYLVSWKVLDAAEFGVPQHRERLFIVARKSPATFDFGPVLDSRKSKRVPFSKIAERFPATGVPHDLICTRFDGKLLETPIKTLHGMILRAKENNYLNNKVYSTNGIVATLCATFTPIIYDERYGVCRRMTISEMLKCQGFPKSFRLPDGVTKTTIARFMGNAVCVPVVSAIIKSLALGLDKTP